MSKKAMIAMSGGVDSSVAAYLIKQQGYDAIGVTMKLFHNEDIGLKRTKTCCSLDDVEDARSVAFKLDIPYYVFNFTDNFESQVIDRFIKAYKNGATPNPCIDCNRYIKFEQLMLRAKQLSYAYVVTGHYSSIEYDVNSKRFLLKKAIDDTKDQSYMLYALTREQLASTLFPLGKLKKSEVREIALKNGFLNAQKHDSQDICFVPDGDYAKFIEQHTGKRYEKGQRKGLGLSFPNPMYVCEKDIDKNTVILGEEKDLYAKSLIAKDINLIACDKIEKPMRVKAKVRYKQVEQWATIEQTDNDKIHVEFDEPQRAIAQGQAVVFYDGDVVVGGGTIE